MFFIKKKRIKKEIPNDLRIELQKIQKDDSIEYPRIKYSISVDNTTLDKAKKEIKEEELKPSFKDTLFKYIDERGLTDPQVYKKAKVDKRIISKLRTEESTYVSRKTAICLGLALELSIDELEDLLKANHDSLYENSYFDTAIKWCIKNKIYDIEQVNDILYSCDLDLLTK